MKGMKLILAILWTVIAAMDIAQAVAGMTPTWVSVFCPLSIVVLDSWMDWLISRKK